MSTELIYKDEVYAIQGAVFEVYKSLVNFGSYPRATVTRWLHRDKRKMFE